MSSQQMPSQRLTEILIIALALLACPLQADDEWRLRVGGAYVDPSIDADGSDLESESDWGLSLAVERMISRRLGVELGAIAANTGYRLEARIFDDLVFRQHAETDLTILTAALNFHLTPDRATDFYIGPLVAFIDFGDTRVTDTLGDRSLTGEFGTSDDFALGAQIGADIPIGQSPWGLHLSAKYIDTELDLDMGDFDDTERDFDPVIFSAGFSFRF